MLAPAVWVVETASWYRILGIRFSCTLSMNKQIVELGALEFGLGFLENVPWLIVGLVGDNLFVRAIAMAGKASVGVTIQQHLLRRL